MKNLMVDIETLGTGHNSVILSIAAVEFDKNGDIGDEFYEKIDLESSMAHGLKIDAPTLLWWTRQKPEIFRETLYGGASLKEVLSFFCGMVKGNTLLWGNSASFDLGILADAYLSMGIDKPWEYWQERCYRSFIEIDSKCRLEKPKGAHHPLIDCKYQILCLAKLIKKYKLPME